MSTEKNMNYFDDLLRGTKTKKQIAVYLDDAKIERIDTVCRIFSSISDAKGFSRNTFIENAVDKFLAESEEYLKEAKDIIVEDEIKADRLKKYDTVVLSATGHGFEDAFLGENVWYPCRISESRLQHLKYIAVYRGAPYSGITHYAKIKEFRDEYREDIKKNCKVCYFDGNPIELPHKIALGGRDACYFIGAKYTKLENLLNAKTTDEITFG